MFPPVGNLFFDFLLKFKKVLCLKNVDFLDVLTVFYENCKYFKVNYLLFFIFILNYS